MFSECQLTIQDYTQIYTRYFFSMYFPNKVNLI